MTEPELTESEEQEIASDLLVHGLDLGPKPGYGEDEAYPDWDSTNTRVISGPLGSKANFSGTRYSSWQEASRETHRGFCVVKFWVCGARWFARVRTRANRAEADSGPAGHGN